MSISYAEDSNQSSNFHVNSSDRVSGHNSQAHTFTCAGLCPEKCCNSTSAQLIAKHRMLRVSILEWLRIDPSQPDQAIANRALHTAGQGCSDLHSGRGRLGTNLLAISCLFPNQLHAMVQKKQPNKQKP